MTQIKKLKLATEDTENTEERIKIKLSGLCDLCGEEKKYGNEKKKRVTKHEPRRRKVTKKLKVKRQKKKKVLATESSEKELKLSSAVSANSAVKKKIWK